MGYVDAQLNVQDLDREKLVSVLVSNLNIDENEARAFIERFYKLMNGHNVPKKGGKVSMMEFLGCGFRHNDVDKLTAIIKYAETIKQNSMLYEVDIPDDNGSNYIDWYMPVDYRCRFYIMRKISYLEQRFNFEPSDSLYELLTTKRNIPGSVLYKTLSGNLGSDKAASLLLMQSGFDGIKYPAGTKWSKPEGAAEDAMNYVIFDANKVKIVNKTRV